MLMKLKNQNDSPCFWHQNCPL